MWTNITLIIVSLYALALLPVREYYKDISYIEGKKLIQNFLIWLCLGLPVGCFVAITLMFGVYNKVFK